MHFETGKLTTTRKANSNYKSAIYKHGTRRLTALLSQDTKLGHSNVYILKTYQLCMIFMSARHIFLISVIPCHTKVKSTERQRMYFMHLYYAVVLHVIYLSSTLLITCFGIDRKTMIRHRYNPIPLPVQDINPHLPGEPVINWTSTFPILGVRFHFYSISNRYSCQQTVKTLIRSRVLRRLVWVCTVCLCPKNGTPVLYGLNGKATQT